VPAAIAARVVLLDGDGRVLLVRRPDTAALHPGCWCLPGGAIDPWETPEQTAERELREEVGLTATLVPGQVAPFFHEGGHSVGMLARDPVGSLRLSRREVAEACWVAPGALPAPMMPGHPEVIALLARQGQGGDLA
jgi:8-oxo-dGTP pyrophosphatase MutT (NUDIX family)